MNGGGGIVGNVFIAKAGAGANLEEFLGILVGRHKLQQAHVYLVVVPPGDGVLINHVHI